MKRMYVSAGIVLAVVSLLWSQPPYPIFGWYSLGLEKTAVHCVLGDDTTMILAGTDKGAMVRLRKEWYKAEGLSLPVHALARVSNGNVVAAAGNGTESDGIYIGTKIKGEPYYSFKVVCWIDNPQALAVSGRNLDTLFTGNASMLYRCVLPALSGTATVKPEQIKLPRGAFGVERPTCAALEVYSGRLVAGGYDRSPMPGPGHLLYNVKDSMHIERKMNVSAMTTIVAGMMKKALAVGTIDSGVYLGTIAGPTLPIEEPWKRFDSPKNEPVNAAIAVPTMIEQQALVVAVKSGVYTGGMNNARWTEIGSIPSAPLCLTLHGNGWTGHNALSYLAGTDNGVYRYGLEPSTGIESAGCRGRASDVPLCIIAGNRVARIVFTSAKAGGAEVAVNDIAGRLLYRHAAVSIAGVNSVTLPLGSPARGTYVVSVRGEHIASVKRTVTLGN